ncbi:MAG TPA: helix-turn-helix domain-containing protein [Clostridiales bacterium]|nr:helix-turn-helix domain-containing protein [Clostridiales bacterium]
MEQQQEKVKQLLETFFKATQIEALYFDCQMNAVSCNYRRYAYNDLLRLSMGGIESFLKEIFKKDSHILKNFYTYYLNHNLICNISILSDGGSCCGAAVTQPVSLNAFKKSDIEARVDGFIQSPSERDEYISAMQRAPVISHDRIISLGEVLSSLSRSLFEETGFHQVICGDEASPAMYRFFHPGKLFNRKPSPSFTNSLGSYPIYLKIKDAISKGDTETLLEVLDTYNSGIIHLDQHTSKDIIRSIKNSFIEGCSMGCFIAIEAGVPYDKAMAFTGELIKEVEDAENINHMYKLMRSALLAFTRSVAATRIAGYPKAVRLAMEYIETHYAKRITLKTLAQQVNLSEFYLSKLIKRETGSNIADIINKVRIEESKKILLEPAVNINELSAMVGYSYSNHFSRVFKQYTGITPSEYRKTIAASEGDSESKDTLRILSDQLSYVISLFPGIFDIGRIIDPVLNLTWMTPPAGGIREDTCYSLWSRKQSCKKCISHMAFEQDRPLVKLDQGAGGRFFVFTAPVTVGNKKYIVELLKNISDNYFDCTNSI